MTYTLNMKCVIRGVLLRSSSRRPSTCATRETGQTLHPVQSNSTYSTDQTWKQPSCSHKKEPSSHKKKHNTHAIPHMSRSSCKTTVQNTMQKEAETEPSSTSEESYQRSMEMRTEQNTSSTKEDIAVRRSKRKKKNANLLVVFYGRYIIADCYIPPFIIEKGRDVVYPIQFSDLGPRGVRGCY